MRRLMAQVLPWLCGGVLLSIWFMWWFAFRSLVARLETIGVEG